MEWVETTGKTVEEAKDLALDALGVHGDDAEFEVVNDVRTGMFGRVKEEARVRARVRPTTPRAKDDRRRRRGGKGRSGSGGESKKTKQGTGGQNRGGGQKGQSGHGGRGGSSPEATNGSKRDRRPADNGGGRTRSRDDAPQAKNPKRDKGKQDSVAESTMTLEEQADIAETFVKDLAKQFGTTVAIDREHVADDEIRLTVSGENLGRMIGQRGTTAGAIDELVRTVLQRHAGSSRDGRVRVDVGGVRARRAEALAAFIRQQAAEVRATGVARALEPMGGADRKIVHDTITDEDGVETISEGEDPNRRVVLVPAGDAD